MADIGALPDIVIFTIFGLGVFIIAAGLFLKLGGKKK